MIQNESWKDQLFRYQSIYRIRRNKKQKQRFLRSLVTDISKVRKDIQVIAYDVSKKQALHNVYVGDLEKADYVISTYYDTPLLLFWRLLSF